MNTVFESLTSLHRENLIEIIGLRNNIEKLNFEHQDSLSTLFNQIFEIIDTYEKAEEAIFERELNVGDTSDKIMDRYKSVLRKLERLIQHYGITKLVFPENKLIVGFCKIVETEPDSTKENDTIVSVVKNGYIHGKDVLRLAEVIIVKNR